MSDRKLTLGWCDRAGWVGDRLIDWLGVCEGGHENREFVPAGPVSMPCKVGALLLKKIF